MSLKKILSEANARDAVAFQASLFEELEARIAAKLGINEAEFTDNELDFEILNDYDHDLNVDASDNDVDIETDDLSDFEDLGDEELDGILADVDFGDLEEDMIAEGILDKLPAIGVTANRKKINAQIMQVATALDAEKDPSKAAKLQSEYEALHTKLKKYGGTFGPWSESVKATKKTDDGEGMDPIVGADKDIDNDGDSDESDDYLHNRRKEIKKDMKEGVELKADGKAAALRKKLLSKAIED